MYLLLLYLSLESIVSCLIDGWFLFILKNYSEVKTPGMTDYSGEEFSDNRRWQEFTVER